MSEAPLHWKTEAPLNSTSDTLMAKPDTHWTGHAPEHYISTAQGVETAHHQILLCSHAEDGAVVRYPPDANALLGSN